MNKVKHITNINDCMDLFPMSAIVMVFQNCSGRDIVVYNGNYYAIPKSYMFVNLNSFCVAFENGRLVYKFYI